MRGSTGLRPGGAPRLGGGSGPYLGLVTDEPRDRLVEVAIDAAGGGGTRTYTYAVPPPLADLESGEAVLVEFGRRQELGIVLGPADEVPGVAPKPVLERVRSDGPLLPPLSVGLARWIAGHYLAPPSLVVRTMLPPGLLERLELVVERSPVLAVDARPGGEARGDGRPGALAAEDEAILDQVELAPRAVRSFESREGRAQLLRRLHALAAAGHVRLDWTLSAAGARPRFERWVVLTPAGREAAALLRHGGRPAGRALGPRQVALLDELSAPDRADAGGVRSGSGAGNGRDVGDAWTGTEDGGAGVPAPELAARHGASATSSLVRRGLVVVVVRERPRLPRVRRKPGGRRARPAGAPLTAAQQDAVRLAADAIADRDPVPIVLDGVTGAGKTAVYVEAISAAANVGRPALLLVP